MKNEKIDKSKPYWQCQECLFETQKKAIPKDRNKFYTKDRFPICPKCKSESLIVIGW